MQELAPLVLFVYKRIDSVKDLIASLLKNSLAMDTDLFIYSDGPRSMHEAPVVTQVREYIYSIEGFKSVTIHSAPVNKGLASSVIDGVSDILQHRGKVIVVEDDLVVSDNFLGYMNQALEYYKDNPKVMSISGFSYPIKVKGGDDVYFTQRACSTGWATWNDRWTLIDWEVQDFSSFKRDKAVQRRFNRMGSDMTGLLNKQMNGRINSWAIRWCYHQLKKDLYTVFPAVSKVKIFGLGGSATHTKLKWNRYNTFLDESGKLIFHFQKDAQLDSFYVKQFVARYSIYKRMFYKIMDLIS